MPVSILRLLAVAALPCLATPATAAPLLASGSYNGSQYQVVGDTAANWSQANAAAQALGPGWHLVAITTAGEQAYLAGLLNGANLGSGQLWAGGLQSPHSNTATANWAWANGEPWGFTAWANDANAAEPNDAFGPGSEGYLTLDGRWARNWTWNDETLGSRQRLGFVAERAVPEPATLALFGAAAAWLVARRRRAAG